MLYSDAGAGALKCGEFPPGTRRRNPSELCADGIRKAAQSSIAPNIDGEFRELPGQAPERSKEVTDEIFPG